MNTSNPLAAVSSDELEEQFEKQCNALDAAIAAGDKVRANRVQAAMRATEAELRRRGRDIGGIDRVRV